MKIWVIADDFTGANDSIVQFAVAGARAVTIGNSQFSKERLKHYQAVAISTNSRGRFQDEAYQGNRNLIQNIPLHSDDLVYKKIDSALRGNIGGEIDALLDCVGEETIVLVAPALPENGRITAGGYQLLNGIPVHETEMASDPVTPVSESHIPTLLAETSNYPVGYLPLGDVCGGVPKALAALGNLRAKGNRLIVADATTNVHLKTLAELCVGGRGKIVPCGTAGLAAALAQRLFTPLPKKNPPTILTERGVVAVIGSRSPMARKQIQRALTELPWLTQIEVDRTVLASGGEQERVIGNTAQAVAQMFAAGKQGVVIRLDDNPAVKPSSMEATILAAGLGKIAHLVTATTGVKKLFLSGGDITAAAIQALGGWGLEIEGEMDSGVCLGKLQGGPFTGWAIVTKAGSFGDEETLVRTLVAMNTLNE